MADTKTSFLPAATSIASADQLPIVQGGITKVGTFALVLSTGAPVTASAYILNAAGIITDATTARTLTVGDNGKFLYFTNAAAITLTLAASLGAGFSCTVLQGAAGQITFAAGGQTTTIANGLTKTAAAGAMATIIAPAANTFFIAGTLA